MFFDPAYPLLKNGLVGYWSPVATGPTGLQLLDLSGQNNHGTLSGMDAPTNWVQSPYGTVLDFDASNDRVVNETSSIYTFGTRDFSFGGWFYLNATTGSYAPLITNWSSLTPSSGFLNKWFLGFFDTRIHVFHSNGGIAITHIPTTRVWSHYAVTRSAGVMTLYVDGSSKGTYSGVNQNFSADGAVSIGGISGSFANILCADAFVSRNSLTASEVQTLYNLGPGKLIRSKPTGGPSKRKWWPGVKTPKSRPIIPTQRGIKSGPIFYDPKASWFRNGLVGHWCPNLTGPTGTQLLDLSGQNNNGALINYGNSLNANTIWLDSQYGTVLTANNISERVDFQNIPQINSGEVTFGFWYYPLSTIGFNTIFNNWSNTQQNGGFYCFRNGATIAFQQDSLSWRVTTGNILTANTWHHIACRRSNGIGGMRIFCNGVIDPASSTAGGTQSTTQPFNLFGPYGGVGAGNCRITDFAIWNRSLTDSEIQQLYQRGPGGFASSKPYRRSSYSPAPKKIFKSRIDRKRSVSLVYPDHDHEWVTNGLVGFWCPSLTSPTGTQLLDLSGQNNNGTLTNMDAPTDWVDSPYGTVLDFDGVNNHVATSAWRGLAGDYSASFWFRTNFATSGAIALLSSSFNGAGGVHVMGIRGADGALYAFAGTERFFGNGYNNNSWVLATITRRFSDGSGTMYANGLQAGTSVSIGTNDPGGGTGWRFGGTPVFGSQFPGQIAGVFFHGRLLTHSEHQQLYQLGPRMGFSNRPSRSPTWITDGQHQQTNRFLTFPG